MFLPKLQKGTYRSYFDNAYVLHATIPRASYICTRHKSVNGTGNGSKMSLYV